MTLPSKKMKNKKKYAGGDIICDIIGDANRRVTVATLSSSFVYTLLKEIYHFICDCGGLFLVFAH